MDRKEGKLTALHFRSQVLQAENLYVAGIVESNRKCGFSQILFWISSAGDDFFYESCLSSVSVFLCLSNSMMEIVVFVMPMMVNHIRMALSD